MQQHKQLGISLLLLAFVVSAPAKEWVRVQAMHYPAWLIRDFQTEPLAPGMQLKVNDLVRTGEGSRVAIELADGSVIKLGESARFIVESIALPGDAGVSSPNSTFKVLRGAFRFTSSSAAGAAEVASTEFGVGAITAGMRRADIWGRSSSRQDYICLIAGEVVANTNAIARLVLDRQHSVLLKPRGKPALPPAVVDAERLARWMTVTDLEENFGIADESGDWQLVLVSLSRRQQADRLMAQLRQQGYAVKLKSVIRQGRTLHRLLLPGFISRDAALAAGSRIESQLGITDAWVWKAD